MYIFQSHFLKDHFFAAIKKLLSFLIYSSFRQTSHCMAWTDWGDGALGGVGGGGRAPYRIYWIRRGVRGDNASVSVSYLVPPKRCSHR